MSVKIQATTRIPMRQVRLLLGLLKRDGAAEAEVDSRLSVEGKPDGRRARGKVRVRVRSKRNG